LGGFGSAEIEGTQSSVPHSDFSWEVDLLCAVPFLGAVAGNLLVAWHSDKMGERKWHLVLCLLGASGGLVFTASAITAPVACLFSLTVTAAAMWGVAGPFWGLLNELTPCDEEALVLAPLVNSIGNLGGVFGPWMLGWIREHSKTYRPALAAMALFQVAAAIPICCLGDFQEEEKEESDSDGGGEEDDEEEDEEATQTQAHWGGVGARDAPASAIASTPPPPHAPFGYNPVDAIGQDEEEGGSQAGSEDTLLGEASEEEEEEEEEEEAFLELSDQEVLVHEEHGRLM